MGNTNRAALIAKAHKVLKQHYTPVAADADRTLMEHLLYACCLENTSYATADKVFAHLKAAYIDWNEVRVSSVTELSESMRQLANPASAASRLKRILQTTFESIYSFDLESMKKKNLGESQKKLEKTEGTGPFIVGFAVQMGLGGHHIPLDSGSLDVLHVLDLATDAEVKSASVAGLERAVEKKKGVEFGSLLHQIGAEFYANPFNLEMRKILLSINPDAKDRFPKKVIKKEEPAPDVSKASAAKKDHPGAKPTDAKAIADKAKHSTEKPQAAGPTNKAAPGDKKSLSDNRDKSAKPEKPLAAADKKHPPADKKLEKIDKKAPASEKKSAADKHKAKPKSEPAAGVKKKSASKQLAKRKPR